MSSHVCYSIIINDVNAGDDSEPIVRAWKLARSIFEEGLVSNLTPVGHNFWQSFCVFPTGSSRGRKDQVRNVENVNELTRFLELNDINFVTLYWDDENGEEPKVVNHSV